MGSGHLDIRLVHPPAAQSLSGQGQGAVGKAGGRPLLAEALPGLGPHEGEDRLGRRGPLQLRHKHTRLGPWVVGAPP